MNSEEKALETMAVFALISLLAGLIFNFTYSLPLACLFILVGLFVKPLAQAIAKAWLKFGMILGEVVNRVLLVVVYFVILTPIAFFYRIFRKDDSFFIKGANKDSYFVNRDTRYSKDDLMRPW